jgi:hypothetical protein
LLFSVVLSGRVGGSGGAEPPREQLVVGGFGKREGVDFYTLIARVREKGGTPSSQGIYRKSEQKGWDTLIASR